MGLRCSPILLVLSVYFTVSKSFIHESKYDLESTHIRVPRHFETKNDHAKPHENVQTQNILTQNELSLYPRLNIKEHQTEESVDNLTENSSQQENLNTEADKEDKLLESNLSLDKLSLESSLINDDTFSEKMELGEKGNGDVSLGNSYSLHDKRPGNADNLDIGIDYLYNFYNKGSQFDLLNFPNIRKIRQVYGDLQKVYTNDMLEPRSSRYENHQEALVHNYFPTAKTNYFSHRKGRQISAKQHSPSLDIAYQNNPEDYGTSYTDYKAYIPHQAANQNQKVPLELQEYQPYYDPQVDVDQISNEQFDDYFLEYQDYLSTYDADTQISKGSLSDESIIDSPVDNHDITSHRVSHQEKGETVDDHKEMDSPLGETMMDEYAAYDNGDVPFFAGDNIGFEGDNELIKEANKLEMDTVEMEDENEIEYEYADTTEKNENEDELTNDDKKEDNSVEKAATRKGAARVFSIDPEGNLSDTGLGEEDVKRLIKQVTDNKEGRNLAFMEKFENIIQKMLN